APPPRTRSGGVAPGAPAPGGGARLRTARPAMVVLKRRYLLFEVIFDRAPRAGSVSEEELAQAARSALAADWGAAGEARAQLRLLWWRAPRCTWASSAARGAAKSSSASRWRWRPGSREKAGAGRHALSDVRGQLLC
ncbi:unnamed protein product, partial [Prorocentrum cordatum]